MDGSTSLSHIYEHLYSSRPCNATKRNRSIHFIHWKKRFARFMLLWMRQDCSDWEWRKLRRICLFVTLLTVITGTNFVRHSCFISSNLSSRCDSQYSKLGGDLSVPCDVWFHFQGRFEDLSCWRHGYFKFKSNSNSAVGLCTFMLAFWN